MNVRIFLTVNDHIVGPGKGNAAEMPELAPFEKKTKTVRQYLTYSLSAAAAAILLLFTD